MPAAGWWFDSSAGTLVVKTDPARKTLATVVDIVR
jgi:hypothetical protein